MPCEAWLDDCRKAQNMLVEQIPFTEMKQWSFQEATGNLVHQSGRFFSIEGIQIHKSAERDESWEQPIIVQPEIGYLGIITQKIHGIHHFLMQAKAEPGNLGNVQLSPTLQATKSNYMQVHKGTSPLYLDYFRQADQASVWVDQLQSEQGARFLKKRNRNIIIEIPEQIKVPVYDNFCWLTLGQLVQLMRTNNLVNMDSRTVLSCLRFGDDTHELYRNELLAGFSKATQNTSLSLYISAMHQPARYLQHELISWITRLKSSYELEVNRIPLKEVRRWQKDDSIISHEQEKYFSVIAIRAQIQHREVLTWDQPMISPAQSGIIAFILKKITGVYHFLVQAKLEAGNFDIIELAPTVQCLTGNYRKGLNEYEVPFLDAVLQASPEKIMYDVMQSEEGGRFYQEENRNMVVVADDSFSDQVPENYIWMTLPQLKEFLQYNNYLNMAARSLLAAIQFE